MRLTETSNRVYPRQNRKNIENFIAQSLLANWAIRVEYLDDQVHGQMNWRAWGKTLFAIASADAVLQAIDACHANYPDNEIRIYAENARPEIRMVYTVFA